MPTHVELLPITGSSRMVGGLPLVLAEVSFARQGYAYARRASGDHRLLTHGWRVAVGF